MLLPPPHPPHFLAAVALAVIADPAWTQQHADVTYCGGFHCNSCVPWPDPPTQETQSTWSGHLWDDLLLLQSALSLGNQSDPRMCSVPPNLCLFLTVMHIAINLSSFPPSPPFFFFPLLLYLPPFPYSLSLFPCPSFPVFALSFSPTLSPVLLPYSLPLSFPLLPLFFHFHVVHGYEKFMSSIYAN